MLTVLPDREKTDIMTKTGKEKTSPYKESNVLVAHGTRGCPTKAWSLYQTIPSSSIENVIFLRSEQRKQHLPHLRQQTERHRQQKARVHIAEWDASSSGVAQVALRQVREDSSRDTGLSGAVQAALCHHRRTGY